MEKIQFPINEKLIDDKGYLTPAWKNELIKLQIVLNKLSQTP